MAFVVDIVYFFVGLFVCYFFWWSVGADCCWGRLFRRRHSRDDQQAIVSIQREILRIHLQQDVQDHLRVLQLLQSHSGNNTLANPEAAEELIKNKRDHRKQIIFQLDVVTREYQKDESDCCTIDCAMTTTTTVQQPATPRRLEQLPACNICMCDYETGEEVSKGSICHHDFHTECIIDWLELNGQCPVCRQEFLPIQKTKCQATLEVEAVSPSSSRPQQQQQQVNVDVEEQQPEDGNQQEEDRRRDEELCLSCHRHSPPEVQHGDDSSTQVDDSPC